MAIFFKPKNSKKKTGYETIGEFVESLGIALIMALMIKASVVEAYRIPSGSMEDTLLVGDFLLANKFVYGMKLPIPFVNIHLPAIDDPKPGDIVIFKYPKNPNINYIKRCIAIEGQTIEIKDKVLYVDGEIVPMPLTGKHTDNRIIPYQGNMISRGGIRDNMPLITVPKGKLFMMGDNRDNSSDSRFWGYLDRDLVAGRAMIIHFSWAPDAEADRISNSGFFSIPKLIGYNIINLPNRVRWNRLADIIH
ncbi:MAG: signal peptidase I [candidate division Zixibacteria bacterium]|nr:signal peptidase I [candidate division Zixibacteria bacterium]